MFFFKKNYYNFLSTSIILNLSLTRAMHGKAIDCGKKIQQQKKNLSYHICNVVDSVKHS